MSDLPLTHPDRLRKLVVAGKAATAEYPEWSEKAMGELAQALLDMSVTPAARDVLAERRRQVEELRFPPDHDDGYVGGELADAAVSYAMQAHLGPMINPPTRWPWNWRWWKPGPARRMLVKAGALILAEIERLDRRDGVGQS